MKRKPKWIGILRLTLALISLAFLLSWVAGQFGDIWLELGNQFIIMQVRHSVVLGIGNTLGIREFSLVPIDTFLRVRAEAREWPIHDTFWEGFQISRYYLSKSWTSYPHLPEDQEARGYVVGFPNWFGALVFALWPIGSFLWTRLNRPTASVALHTAGFRIPACLPGLCMICGTPTNNYYESELCQSVRLLVSHPMSPQFRTTRISLSAPLCTRHKGALKRDRSFSFPLVLGLIAMGIAGIASSPMFAWIAIICFGLAILVGFVTACPIRISCEGSLLLPQKVTLFGVSQEFAKKVNNPFTLDDIV